MNFKREKTKLRLKIVDLLFLFLIFILTIISVDLLINVKHQQAIENISRYQAFQDLATGLLITFWVCLVGNLLPVPTPYTWVVCYSSQPYLRLNLFVPFLVGFIASLGCLLGEMGGYAIGRWSGEVIDEKKIENLKKLQIYLVNHPKIAPILIFLAALTPISDDLIVIPLGLIKYSPKKTILFCWLGKLGLMLIFAYNLINICDFIGGESWILSIVSLYVLVILIYLFVRVDFLKFLSKREKTVEES